jgi:hypothetical protein
MAFDLVLPQVLPRAEFLAALFAGILRAPLALLLGCPALCHVVADEPLCDPDQANVVAERSYMEICVIAY